MSLKPMTETAVKLLQSVAMLALLGLVLVTAVDVVGRVVFDAPLGFAYELIGVLLGVAVYGGLSRVNLRDEHIRIDLLEHIFNNEGALNTVRRVVIAVMEITFYAVLAIYVFRQMTALKKWRETFLFLPLEKWLPLALFGGLAGCAVLALILAKLMAARDDRPAD